MPEASLEFPGEEVGAPDWDALYLYRNDEVPTARPTFTGDVFSDLTVQAGDGTELRSALVIQHPCALRTNGVDLTDRLVVVDVQPYKLLAEGEWRGNYRLMPLPALSNLDGEGGHHAAFFVLPYLTTPDALNSARRVACLSTLGVNILLQRWVYHNSRIIVPTWRYNEVIGAQYEEADGIEEWCTTRIGHGLDLPSATHEADSWLSSDGGSGISRRRLLENPQYRSNVRRSMRKEANSLRSSG